jgi:hypothetical protein
VDIHENRRVISLYIFEDISMKNQYFEKSKLASTEFNDFYIK